MTVRTTVNVMLPPLGESVREVTILAWRKPKGATVVAGEVLADVSDDKVDVEVMAPASGTLVVLHCQVGDTVAIEAVLAEIAPGEDLAPDEPRTPAQPVVERQSQTISAPCCSRAERSTTPA
jgi:pyruvate/2-oxoglutarate dehydrogenase complex dihydrolipoamide acyltransferase (E2) component